MMVPSTTDPPGTTYRIEVSPHIATQIVKQCLKETRYFALKPLTKLIKLNCLSYRDCPELPEAALGTDGGEDRYELLIACIMHLGAIEEPVMVSCMKAVYARANDSENAMTTLADDVPDDGDGPTESEFQSFMRHVRRTIWCCCTAICTVGMRLCTS